jgi:hypothetical protein
MRWRTAIKREVESLGGSIREALEIDPRAATVRHRQSRPRNDGTGGYWVRICKLNRAITAELWVDLFSGFATPRAYFGLTSSSRDAISSLTAMSQRAGFKKPSIERSFKDMTGGPLYKFEHPLAKEEFDVLVKENYPGEHFLGIYAAYKWPFTLRSRAAISRDAANFIASFAALLSRNITSRDQNTVGPWARPDPKVERAAVRHVKELLLRKGYRVRSREREVCGYDLHATKRRSEMHVEVKGCSGMTPGFFISRTEHQAYQTDPKWRLVVVTGALRRPVASKYLTRSDVNNGYRFEPVQWRAQPHS